ncbi:hypothetical protein BH24CHL10_BH24CHL10_01510 [soil metagenome]
MTSAEAAERIDAVVDGLSLVATTDLDAALAAIEEEAPALAVVDAVIYLEGERLGATRLLRAAKNRFGSQDEVGVLEMRADGIAEVADASRFFIESNDVPTAGSAVTIALEGTRRLAVEIQALSAPSSTARRAARLVFTRLAARKPCASKEPSTFETPSIQRITPIRHGPRHPSDLHPR